MILRFDSKIAIFQKKEIRKIIHEAALTDSKDPAQYFKKMKARDTELKKLTEKGGVQFAPPLRLNIEITGGN